MRAAWRCSRLLVGAVVALLVARSTFAQGGKGVPIAIAGATLIDGNGGAPVPDAVVVVSGAKIVAVGPRSSVTVPKDARVVDGTGKYLTPGFIDTNVHLSMYGGGEAMLKYQSQLADIVIETAQLNLKHGITTVRDSYGMLKPLLAARDAINRGEVVGPRMYVAGNIVGWGANKSFTFSGTGAATAPSFFEEQMQDAITEGAGEELINLEPDSLRVMMRKYLDKGVDFVKYGGTTHAFFPALITFSERAQKALVDEVHKRGKIAETHATSPEGARMAVEAGIDLMQHPEAIDGPMSDSLAKLIVDRKVICSILANRWTGESWKSYLKQRAARDSTAKKLTDSLARHPEIPRRPQTSTERMNVEKQKYTEWRHDNAQKLIRAGCTVSVSTDQTTLSAAELRRTQGPAVETGEAGMATIQSIEGLVELGMTPMQALVAATKNGALASHELALYGTVEPGKFADLLLLDADPTADIHNIRKLSLVMHDGRIIDTEKLPEKPIFYGRRPAIPIP